jgi:hypothetical protein
MGGWRCLRLKTLPSSPPRVPVEDTLQEVPEEGQQEEEDAVDDAPSVGAAAIMATEALEVLEGVVATPQRAQRHLWLFADPSASSAATRTIRPSKHQAKGRARRA